MHAILQMYVWNKILLLNDIFHVIMIKKPLILFSKIHIQILLNSLFDYADSQHVFHCSGRTNRWTPDPVAPLCIWGVPVRYPDRNDITCLQQLCLNIKLKIYLLMSWRSLNLFCQDFVYFFWRGVNNGLKSVQQWMDGSMFADYSKGVSFFFWQIMVYMYMCVQNLLHKNSYIRPPSDAFV